jgi:homoaconitase/3-isopropylmalate dehydratase large subunit
MENLGLKPRPFYGGEDVKEELKAIYNDRVVYGLTDNSNVYIDAVSLKEVLDCSIYSELMKSNRLWVSADDLAVILEDNNCPTDDFEKWLLSIRGMDNKPTH